MIFTKAIDETIWVSNEVTIYEVKQSSRLGSIVGKDTPEMACVIPRVEWPAMSGAIVRIYLH